MALMRYSLFLLMLSSGSTIYLSVFTLSMSSSSHRSVFELGIALCCDVPWHIFRSLWSLRQIGFCVVIEREGYVMEDIVKNVGIAERGLESLSCMKVVSRKGDLSGVVNIENS